MAIKVNVFVTFVEPVTFPDVSMTPDSSLFGILLLTVTYEFPINSSFLLTSAPTNSTDTLYVFPTSVATVW